MSRATSRGRRPRRRLALGAVLLAVLVPLLSGCETTDIPAMIGIPNPATEQGQWIHSLWQGSWVAAWTVGGITWVLILWAAIAYRRRSESAVPRQTRYNLPIEALYTVLPIIVIAVLFGFTARDQSRLLKVDNREKNTVNVVAFRWNWTFNYVDQDVYDIGSPQHMPTLYLPVGEPVRFTLNSPDVIHSFWVPDFLFKMDVIPGKTNQFELTPTKEGTFAGRCAELCGVDHSKMLFQVKVVSAASFQAHMEELRSRGQVGLLQTGRAKDAYTGDTMGRTTIGGSS